MKNRRADIPIVVLVLGVVAICGLAILSFIVSEKSILDNYNDPLGLEVFERFHSDIEKDNFYEKVGVPKQFDIKNYQNGSVIIKSYTPIK